MCKTKNSLHTISWTPTNKNARKTLRWTLRHVTPARSWWICRETPAVKRTWTWSIGVNTINPCAPCMVFLPWEPKTSMFRGCNPYIGGLKPSFFMVLGSKGRDYMESRWLAAPMYCFFFILLLTNRHRTWEWLAIYFQHNVKPSFFSRFWGPRVYDICV